MSLSDPIADFLTRIRNAALAELRYTDVRWSKVIQNMADVMQSANLIEHYLVREVDGKMQMRIFLKYDRRGNSIIRGVKRISKPGCRVYMTRRKIPSVFNTLGTAILTTSQGVLSGEQARKQGVGGEVLCYVW